MEQQVSNFFCTALLYHKEHYIFEDFSVLPACPSDKNIIKMK